MNSMYPMKIDQRKTRPSTTVHAKPACRTAGSAESGRRIQVRRSGVHGKGVFALQPIAEGETIIEYMGEVITWKEAQRRHPHDPNDPNHTFYFHIDDKRVIDAAVGGNSARWINHACDPNCEADEDDGRVFIKALRNIEPGEELNYDYGLIIDGPLHPEAEEAVRLPLRRTRLPRHDARAQALTTVRESCSDATLHPLAHRSAVERAVGRCCRGCRSRWWRAANRPTPCCWSARAVRRHRRDAVAPR